MPTLPPGLYDQLVTIALQGALSDPGTLSEIKRLDPEVADEALARHVFHLVRAVLSGQKGRGEEKLATQLALVNRVVELLAEESEVAGADDAVTPERLLQVSETSRRSFGNETLLRPTLPLRRSDLFVNGPQDLRVGAEIQRELASADRVDVLVSFVKWSGFVELRDALQDYADRHAGAPHLRLLTTTYMGATEVEALDAMRSLGAQVRVSYDTRRTRLHAKAWLFHRDTGFSTAIIGSSNLSHAAMRDGCEWNVRLSNVDNGAILRKFEATFEQYWADPSFEAYDAARFSAAIGSRRNAAQDYLASAVGLFPYPHQQSVLDALEAERTAGHNKNLVVAATGTGKTVMAALDYARQPGRPSLLFVAHRAEILQQSLATYRVALRDGNFGELLTGKHKPIRGEHIFATIQSLHATRLATVARNRYRVVVIDEFHHAAAETYERLLQHVEPEILLGLTATPERADGRSILHWFDGRVAAESRLWDALDQNLLVPFQYFGIDDGTDLSHVDFRAGRYSSEGLNRVYTADDARARQVLRGVHERVRDPRAMRALGFCVSVKHARFMAEFFRAAGLPATYLHAADDGRERKSAIDALERGEICALFTVDLFNEGVDIPVVDTVLFLRPTESATVYLQQLGRGLRLHPNKACLTVLDFVGRAHRNFRFDRRYRALLGGGTRAEVQRAIESDFPHLPSGCSMQLERRARDVVLENIRRPLNKWPSLADELREDWSLQEFTQRADLELEEIYRSSKTFTELRWRRGYVTQAPPEPFARALPRLLHVDDADRLDAWRTLLATAAPPERPPSPKELMFFAALGKAQQPVSAFRGLMRDIWSEADTRDELLQLLACLDDRRRRPTYALPGLPLRVHATYSRDEVSAGLGETRKGKLLRTQGGVYKCEVHCCDVLFVTLEKDAKDFTPTTLYNDYPLSRSRFHWESQRTTRYDSPTGRRYRTPPKGWRILLFVRRTRKDDRGLTSPYLCLGPVRCVRASGDRPMQIEWELERPMPAGWFAEVKVAAG